MVITWGHKEDLWHSFKKKRYFVLDIFITNLRLYLGRFIFEKIEGKKKMKRLLSVVCVFLMLIALCGCTNATNIETNNEPANNNNQEMAWQWWL